MEWLEYWERFLKSKAAGCGSTSTVVYSIVSLCVSSIIIANNNNSNNDNSNNNNDNNNDDNNNNKEK